MLILPSTLKTEVSSGTMKIFLPNGFHSLTKYLTSMSGSGIPALATNSVTAELFHVVSNHVVAPAASH